MWWSIQRPELEDAVFQLRDVVTAADQALGAVCRLNRGLTGSVPVVILISSSEEADLVRGYQGGANSYVVKPVDFAQFVEAVSQLGLDRLLLNGSPRPTPCDDRQTGGRACR